LLCPYANYELDMLMVTKLVNFKLSDVDSSDEKVGPFYYLRNFESRELTSPILV